MPDSQRSQARRDSMVVMALTRVTKGYDSTHGFGIMASPEVDGEV